MIATRFPGNLYYLTDELPPKYGYIKKVVKALNGQGKTSNSGKLYTDQIVANAVRGMVTDENVKTELESLVATYKAEVGRQQKKQAQIEARRNKRLVFFAP